MNSQVIQNLKPASPNRKAIAVGAARTLFVAILAASGPSVVGAQGLPMPARFGSAAQAAPQRNRVDPPATESRSYRPFQPVTVEVPANWTELGGGSDSISYSPAGGRVVNSARAVETTHGVEVALFQAASAALAENTNTVVGGIIRANPRARVQANLDGSPFSQVEERGRPYLRVAMTNINGYTGTPEYLLLFTTQLTARRVLLLLFTMPADEIATYQTTIAHVVASVHIDEDSPSPPTGGSARSEGLVGSWRTAGLILVFRANGTFERVSHSGAGSFGGIAGLDDGGPYSVNGDEISLQGMVIKRTCKYALRGGTLTFCGENYTRE